jgi:hypothetical protein
MGQKGFFDVERRLQAISAKGDPLETIKKIVPWEDFHLCRRLQPRDGRMAHTIATRDIHQRFARLAPC